MIGSLVWTSWGKMTWHDSFSLLQELQLHSHDQYVNNLFVYGDPAYPLRQLQVQFHGAVLIKQEEA